MANRTTANTPATGTPVDVMTDERVVALLADGVAAKVQYIAEIDGTPDSSNVGIIDAAGAKRVAIADGGDVAMGAKGNPEWDLIAASPSAIAIFKKMALLLADDTLVNLVRPEPLTKYEQGANGLTVQALKDAGRTLVVLTTDYLVPSAVETLVTMSWTEDLVPGAGGTSYMVPAGKKLRIQNVHGYPVSPVNVTGRADPQIWMRASVSGDITTASPIIGMLPLLTSLTPNNNASQPTDGFKIPEGLELSALNEVGFSQLSPDWVNVTKHHRLRITAICYLY